MRSTTTLSTTASARQTAASGHSPGRGGFVRKAATGLVTAGLLCTMVPLAAAAPKPAAAQETPRRILSGWLPYWSTNSALNSVENSAEIYTDAMPFWYDLRRDGSLRRKSTGTTDTVIANTVNRLHAAGIPVYPTAGQEQNTVEMVAFLENDTKRKLHVEKIVAEAVLRNYDGFDLDYEAMNFGGTTADRVKVREGFVRLAKELAAALHAQGKKLSITVGPRVSDLPTSNWAVYDYAALGAAADRFRIMTYDYGWRGGKANPVSPLWWVETVLKYTVARVPASKVWVGVPTYGYDWPATGNATAVSFSQAKALQAQYGAQRVWNDVVSPTDSRKVMAPSFSYTKNGVAHKVWYNDAASIRAIVGLVGEYRLGGAALWSLGSEDSTTWGALRAYARSVAPRDTVAALSPSVPTVRYGTEATLTASVKNVDGTPAAGVSISLQGRAKSVDAAWSKLAGAASDEAGTAEFAVLPRVGWEYRVATAASWSRASAASPPHAFSIYRKVGMLASSGKVKGVRTVRLKGNVAPGVAGLTVEQQQLVRGKWTTVATGITRAKGAFNISVAAPKLGLQTYRAVVLATADYSGNVTASVTLNVK